MNVTLPVNHVPRKSCWGEKEGVVLVPFLGQVAGGIVAIEPYHEGNHAMAIRESPPPIAENGVGKPPRAYATTATLYRTYLHKHEQVLRIVKLDRSLTDDSAWVGKAFRSKRLNHLRH